LRPRTCLNIDKDLEKKVGCSFPTCWSKVRGRLSAQRPGRTRPGDLSCGEGTNSNTTKGSRGRLSRAVQSRLPFPSEEKRNWEGRRRRGQSSLRKKNIRSANEYHKGQHGQQKVTEKTCPLCPNSVQNKEEDRETGATPEELWPGRMGVSLPSTPTGNASKTAAKGSPEHKPMNADSGC